MVDLEQIKITRRDEQVLKLLVQGCSNKEIAAELQISPRTVKQRCDHGLGGQDQSRNRGLPG